MITTVTFDCWDTLLVAPAALIRTRRLHGLTDLFDGHDPREIETALDAAVAAYGLAWHAGRQFGAADAAGLIATRLDAGRDRIGEISDILIQANVVPHPAPHVGQVLKTLHDNGIRLGIICDVALTPSPVLRSHLAAVDLLPAFDHWSFSDEVGWYKPDPRIFAHAHEGLGVSDPAVTAHIGDLTRTDVAGALGVGATAIRYTGITDDQREGPRAHHVIDDHRALPAILGLE